MGCPPSWSPHPVPSALGSRARALTCFERATGSSLRGSRSLSSPQLKAGATVHPPSSCLPGAGAWIWPSTCPPSLCRGASRVLKMEKVPHLALEPLCLPSSWPRESVLGIRPRAPFSPPAYFSCENVFTGVYFLLEMSLLGMNVDWFVLKLVNCLRKTCGCSMRQPPRGGEDGPSLPPSTLAGTLRVQLRLWHRSKHTGRSRGMTLSLVLVGVRG